MPLRRREALGEGHADDRQCDRDHRDGEATQTGRRERDEEPGGARDDDGEHEYDVRVKPMVQSREIGEPESSVSAVT